MLQDLNTQEQKWIIEGIEQLRNANEVSKEKALEDGYQESSPYVMGLDDERLKLAQLQNKLENEFVIF
jgi:hypothetical protein